MTGVVIAGGSGENGRITATRGRVLAREDHVGSRIWPALPPARGVPCRSGGPSPFVVLGSSSGSDSRLASPNRHDVRPSKPSRYDHVCRRIGGMATGTGDRRANFGRLGGNGSETATS